MWSGDTTPASADWITSLGAAEITKNENRWPSTPRVEKVDERLDVAAQPNAPSGLLEVLAPHAPELRVVTNQVRQLAPLLDQVAPGQPVDLFLEAGGANQLAQYHPRIVEAERLVEVRRDQKVLRRSGCHEHVPS